MPPSPALAARDQRILAGHAAGATVIHLAVAEEVDTATIRRVPLPPASRLASSVIRALIMSPSAWLIQPG